MCVKNYFLVSVAVSSLHIDAHTALGKCALFFKDKCFNDCSHKNLNYLGLLVFRDCLGFIFNEKATE